MDWGMDRGLSDRLTLAMDGVIDQWLKAAWLVGLGGGVVVGLLTGGQACLQHYILRLMLSYRGATSWHTVNFLDEAARRILLYKIGGGYIFIHRLLLDYFASLEKKEP